MPVGDSDATTVGESAAADSAPAGQMPTVQDDNPTDTAAAATLVNFMATLRVDFFATASNIHRRRAHGNTRRRLITPSQEHSVLPWK
jgi:hypothetical protein